MHVSQNSPFFAVLFQGFKALYKLQRTWHKHTKNYGRKRCECPTEQFLCLLPSYLKASKGPQSNWKWNNRSFSSKVWQRAQWYIVRFKAGTRSADCMIFTRWIHSNCFGFWSIGWPILSNLTSYFFISCQILPCHILPYITLAYLAKSCLN